MTRLAAHCICAMTSFCGRADITVHLSSSGNNSAIVAAERKTTATDRLTHAAVGRKENDDDRQITTHATVSRNICLSCPMNIIASTYKKLGPVIIAQHVTCIFAWLRCACGTYSDVQHHLKRTQAGRHIIPQSHYTTICCIRAFWDA